MTDTETKTEGNLPRVTTRTRAAIIEAPASVGPVADPGAVADAIIRWLSEVYDTDPAARALIDKYVLSIGSQVPTGGALPLREAEQEAA